VTFTKPGTFTTHTSRPAITPSLNKTVKTSTTTLKTGITPSGILGLTTYPVVLSSLFLFSTVISNRPNVTYTSLWYPILHYCRQLFSRCRYFPNQDETGNFTKTLRNWPTESKHWIPKTQKVRWKSPQNLCPSPKLLSVPCNKKVLPVPFSLNSHSVSLDRFTPSKTWDGNTSVDQPMVIAGRMTVVGFSGNSEQWPSHCGTFKFLKFRCQPCRYVQRPNRHSFCVERGGSSWCSYMIWRNVSLEFDR